MPQIADLIQSTADWLFVPVLVIVLFGTGLFLTARLGVVQVRRFGEALRAFFGGRGGEGGGVLTPFQAFMTALGTTIGTGNIAGVAAGIVSGGPGVLFWIMGIAPVVIGFQGWRAARRGASTPASTTMNRLTRSVTLSNRIEYAPNSFGAPRPSPSVADRPDAPADDDIDEALVDRLERLSWLHAEGALSDEEFAAAKARILANQSLDA